MNVHDCFLPAAIWDRLRRLDTAIDFTVAIYLWAQADRDGIAPVNKLLPAELMGVVSSMLDPDPLVHFSATEAALHLGGFAVMYRGLDGAVWAWIPDVPVYAPPQTLQRPFAERWPAPTTDAVRAILSVRLGRDATEAECKQACPRAYGRKRAASPPMGDEVDRVYREWRLGQKDKEGRALDLPESPSPAQRRMIVAALKECPGDTPAEVADAMILILRYVYAADDKPARYLRGQNDQGRAYLGLDNLTVTSKVRSRLGFARAWMAQRATSSSPSWNNEPGIDLGPLGRFRG